MVDHNDETKGGTGPRLNRRAFAIAGASAVAIGAGAWWWSSRSGDAADDQADTGEPAEAPIAPEVDLAGLTPASLKLVDGLTKWFDKRGLQIDRRVYLAFAERVQSAGRNPKVNRSMAQRFILSTDFIQNGTDPSKTVRWVAYYDPYSSPCYNPTRMPAATG